ncbi:hypothetical protein Vretimale_11668 [Volvox reticuliferus]|uniref:Glycosyltransferase family 92 protein n=1 Tax=Volvox reticuliferus TaxID=1737510 RepID=A0A8J4GH13_9CHLO|nr:hypothetical protein Vretifemale_14721 [Volvox reticuliferus]GIM07585.1 hypothetical protein Vretimale_11668 [Volvox reticuliferus]
MRVTVSASICIIVFIFNAFATCVRSQDTREVHHHLRDTVHDLGVVPVQLYAKAPVLVKEKVLLLNIWLKRVTWENSSGQHERSEVHGFAWAEDMDALNRNQEGHMLMGVDHNVWQPRLRLETPRGTVLSAQRVSDVVKDPQAKSSLRPFHFTFVLDAAHPGRCFKIYELSFPGYRSSFCLPLTSSRLCRRLVPEETEAPHTPALWSLIFPLRSTGINGTHWEYHTRLIANRIFNYAVYQIGIGGAGVLLYADRMARAGLERLPRIAGLIAKGRLIMVTWDMPERSPMAYKYDQALVASHALLGLSSCGPSLMLLLGDLDEYLYSAFGHGWPSIHECLTASNARAGLYRIQRIDAATSRMDPSREAAWWVVPARSLSRHPIMSYDKLKREAMRPELGKVLALPSSRIVGFYVHDGFPMYGTSHQVGAECAFLVHIPNYWGPRAAVAAAAAAGGGGGIAAVAATEDSAAAATVAATGGGLVGGTALEGLDSLLNTDGAGGIGASGSTVGKAAGGTAAGSRAGGASSAAVQATDAVYTPFKVSANWAVGPSATAALEGPNGILLGVGRGGGASGSSGTGTGRMREGGTWNLGSDGVQGAGRMGGRGAFRSGSAPGGEIAAAAAAAAALAAANAAAWAGKAANTATTTTTAATGQASTVAADSEGSVTDIGIHRDEVTSGGSGSANVAADADRLAALAAEKALVARLEGKATASKSVTTKTGSGVGAMFTTTRDNFDLEAILGAAEDSALAG